VFLSAEEVRILEQQGGGGSGGSGGVSVSACMAHNMRTNSAPITTHDSVEAVNDSLQNMTITTANTTTTTTTATLTISDVEDHKGVKIWRRVKVAATSNYFDPTITSTIASTTTTTGTNASTTAMNNTCPSTNALPTPPVPLTTSTTGVASFVVSDKPEPIIRNPRRDRSKVGAGSKVNWIKNTTNSTSTGTSGSNVTYGSVGGMNSAIDKSTVNGEQNSASTDLAKNITSTTTTTTADNTTITATNTDPTTTTGKKDRGRPGMGGRVSRDTGTSTSACSVGSTKNASDVTVPIVSVPISLVGHTDVNGYRSQFGKDIANA
jgi:hypothetical protein